MVLNAAVQMLREADELKQKILKFKSGTSMLQERSLWATQQQLQKVYQKVLVLDLDYALDKKVEQDLWNVGFKQQIEALQAISKDRKNPLRSEGQAMLSWVLQAAAGFYLCLLHQICTAFKLDLPFRRRASLLGWVEGWGAGTGAPDAAATGRGAPAAARYICQHCLVHLGDLARYRQQLRVAHTFYRHALVVSAHSGQPYNQLALVWWRRGRRLGALYWHVRSLLVRAPFPPAPTNLRRTLRAAAAAAAAATTGASGRELQGLPVLPGITPAPATAGPGPALARLDAHSYVSDLIRALHLIHTVEELETATGLVESLNSALAALVATDSFESMTLIKMAVVIMWLVQSSTEGGEAALAQSEAAAAALAHALACGAVLALLLPAYALSAPPARALPALKVWLQWLTCVPASCTGAAWVARPQLWPALAHNLNLLADDAARVSDKYDTIPLPEDEELLGFLPLEPALSALRFPSHAALDRKPEQNDIDENDCGGEVSPACLSNEPALEARVRARRLVQLGRMLADQNTDQLSYTEEDNKLTFTATPIGDSQLSQLVRALNTAHVQAGGGGGGGGDDEGDSDDDRAATAPPTVISEADFREKVREKRVGILKPQGSLERAREERAMANTQDDEGDTSEDLKGEDKKEARKPRVNIAMAAIMRKQEETNKQVKFVTPPPTPDSIPETDVKDAEKPKMIQPKPIKSLANLPIGRKTGGILSLKDKSAGYPHLVNTDPEPKKEEEKKKEVKPNQSSQNSQQYLKRPDQPSPNWPANTSQAYEGPRMNFPKTYGIQSPGLSYSPGMNYPQPTMNNQGIRLPVVNPKEIDVRTAALQKQNSRQELFQDGHKFGNYKYQVSGDKKNFLNDLPPRFANQYRYWQTAQDNQFNDNKFRDENFQSNNSLFNTQQRPNWMNTTPLPETYQQPNPWWTPEKPPPNFNANFTTPMNIQPNFYSPHLGTNMASPYPNMSFNQMPNQIGQDKPQNLITPPNYLQTAIGQPQMPTLQNLVSSPNFNSSLNNFGSYAPPVGYDSSMYPQFNNKLGYQPLQMKMMDKPQSYQNKDMMDMGGLGFGGNVMDMQQRNLMTFNDPMAGGNDVGGAKNLEQMGPGVAGSPPGGEAGAGAAAGNTYSLFSGAADTSAWAAAAAPRLQHQPQSLWSGPGPSPLERLLEQQKQMKPAPAPH